MDAKQVMDLICFQVTDFDMFSNYGFDLFSVSSQMREIFLAQLFHEFFAFTNTGSCTTDAAVICATDSPSQTNFTSRESSRTYNTYCTRSTYFSSTTSFFSLPDNCSRNVQSSEYSE